MSLKVKLTSTIAAFLLILGLTIMGVFAAPTATVLLGGTISFKATDVHARVSGTITGSVEAEAETSKELALETLEFSSGKETDVSSWADTDITFQDSGAMVTIKIVIENLATDRMLYASVADNMPSINNVTKTMKQLSSLSDAAGTEYTGDVLSIPANSGNGTNIAYIQLTLQVTNPNASLDAGATYGYSIDLNNEVPEEPAQDASVYEAKGMTFVYDKTKNTASVKAIDADSFTYSALSGDVVIPSHVLKDDVKYTVTGIASCAFGHWQAGKACDNVTSFTIPETVTSIGMSAFAKCSGFSSIIIPDSVTLIDSDAFNGCDNLTEVSIGAGVQSMGMSVFKNCVKLQKVTIEKGAARLGTQTFNGCTELKSITIPGGVDINNTFLSCSNITSVIIEDGMVTISSYAFSGSGLTEITIPSSVTNIENFAFQNCTALTTVYYTGTTAQWEALKVNIGTNNEPLLNANVICSDTVTD